MADNTNYIGVSMGMDVTDLKAGLSEANKQIQLANSEFKAASSGMEDWTKSTEGLTAKVKQLDTVLNAQKSKLAGLQAEYKKVAEEQGENSEAARKLQIQINNQQAVVNKTQKEFDNYSETLKLAEQGEINLAEATLRQGTASQKTVSALSKETQALFENVEVTKKTEKLKGDLAEAQARYAAALKKANGDTAKINAANKEFRASLERISIELREVDQSQRDASESAGGLGSAWQGIGTVAKGVVGGIAAIGAAAVGAVAGFLSLAESTRETRENFNKLETAFTTADHSAADAQKTYKSLYGILGDEGQATEAASHLALLAKSQEDLSKWTDISAGVYATFGDSLPIENLAEASNETAKTGKLTGGLADALNWAGVNEEEFQAKLDAASTEQERQALITETLNGLYSEQSDKFKELNGDIIAAREADAELAQTMAELGAIAEPIMTTLKTLTTELLQEIKPFVELIGTGLKGALEGSAGATDTLAQGLSGILSTLGEKILGLLPTVLSTLASLVSTLLPQLLSTVSGLIPPLIETLAAQLPVILQAVLSGINQILTTIGGMLPELIPLAIDAVLTLAETLIDNIDLLIDAGISLLMGLADGLIVALPRLLDKIPVIIEKLMSAFSRNGPKLIQAGIELTVKLAAGLIKAIPNLLAAIPQIIASIVGGFGEYYSKMGEVGLNIVKGIWDGITGGAKWLKDKIFGFADDVAGWFKKTFKISSPSRLIEDEVGKFVGQGVIPTSPRALSNIKKQISKFGGFVTDNLGNIKAGLSVNAGGTGRGGIRGSFGGSTVVNAGMTVNYNGKLSRKELKRIENDNYTAIRTRLVTEGAI